MDTPVVTNASTQSIGGHHHGHGGNMTDKISKMATGIDDVRGHTICTC